MEFSGASIMTKGVNFKQECIDECYLRSKVIMQKGIGNFDKKIMLNFSCRGRCNFWTFVADQNKCVMKLEKGVPVVVDG